MIFKLKTFTVDENKTMKRANNESYKRVSEAWVISSHGVTRNPISIEIDIVGGAPAKCSDHI